MIPGRAPPPLPDDFVFGVANADHQVEAYDERYADIRDLWEAKLHQTPRGRATDFWTRYPEDVGLARELGCRMFRFGISWARVEPAPGVYSDEALAHYRAVADEIRAAGMEPMPTLLHFTWPLHVQDRGGFTWDGFPETFARYATQVAQAIGPVDWWITINEPTLLPFGYVKPWWQSEYAMPPGLPPDAMLADQLAAIRKLIRNLFLAHAAARDAIKAVQPQARVGANPALLGLPPWLQRLIDRNATRMGSIERWLAREKRFTERPAPPPKADAVIGTLTRTASRREVVDFSDVYLMTGQAVLVPEASPVAAAADLAGKRVAIVAAAAAPSALDTLPDATLRPFPSERAALAALDAGDVDALLADEAPLRALAAARDGEYRIAVGGLTTEPYAVAVAKGRTELLKAVDLAVRDVTEGSAQVPTSRTDRALADVGRVPGPPPAAAGTSLARLRRRNRITIAVRDDLPGIAYRDPETGDWSGTEIDLAHAIGRRAVGPDGTVELVPVGVDERLNAVKPRFRALDALFRVVSLVSSVVTTNWWNLGLAGRLPEFLCPAECVGACDFVGFDYYWGVGALRLGRIQHLVAALTAGRYDIAPVWPRGLSLLLQRQAELLPGQPIVIVENGCVDVADGVTRSDYLRRHLREVRRMRARNVPVAAYLCWSITSNREWGLPFSARSDFGLYHVDLDADPELRRTPTDAVATYAGLIAARGGDA